MKFISVKLLEVKQERLGLDFVCNLKYKSIKLLQVVFFVGKFLEFKSMLYWEKLNT